MLARKPLGGKGYGSIPHLPGSRMGPADHHCEEGQKVICWETPRDKDDRIIVTEKLDGSNMCVANVDGQILAIGRAGYLSETSPFRQHHLFTEWVMLHRSRFERILSPGERIVGEWLAQAHGTRYKLAGDPFVPFDFFAGKGRVAFDFFEARCGAGDFVNATVLHDGGPIGIERVLPLLETSGHGALDPVEGAVWRVERRGRFDFLAKWVRPDKKDGVLLPEINGTGEAIWNWQP